MGGCAKTRTGCKFYLQASVNDELYSKIVRTVGGVMAETGTHYTINQFINDVLAKHFEDSALNN